MTDNVSYTAFFPSLESINQIQKAYQNDDVSILVKALEEKNTFIFFTQEDNLTKYIMKSINTKNINIFEYIYKYFPKNEENITLLFLNILKAKTNTFIVNRKYLNKKEIFFKMMETIIYDEDYDLITSQKKFNDVFRSLYMYSSDLNDFVNEIRNAFSKRILKEKLEKDLESSKIINTNKKI